MIDPDSLEELQRELRERIEADRAVLDELRAQVRSGLGDVRRIQPRSTTAISLVGTDGGNNRVEFDPFLAQLVRVVDSSNNEHALEVITPSTNIEKLSRKHRPTGSAAISALGKMMEYLDVEMLWDLSPMIAPPSRESASSWVQVYRELTEWAVLFKLVREKDYGTDTLVVFDGQLRSKVFKGARDPLFARLATGLREAIDAHARKKRRVYVVGVAKHSKVLDRFRLAMMLEGVLRTDFPAYTEVGRELEEAVYRWGEYARGSENVNGGEANKFVAGKMFFVKFGGRPRDPIWPIDVFEPQVSDAPTIFGHLLADAIEGFPVPFYPSCLQRAHEHAALVDFDMDILQRGIVEAIRESLGTDASILDELQLISSDPAARRYQ